MLYLIIISMYDIRLDEIGYVIEQIKGMNLEVKP